MRFRRTWEECEMDTVTYTPLTAANFSPHSLDGFVRRQRVEECWRRVDGALVLRPVEYVEDWDVEERRKIAAEILRRLDAGGAAFGALCGGEVAGFALLSGERMGPGRQYADLLLFYVSEPFRGRGIGGALFRMACGAARELGARRLYISAHSAREVIAAYRALGCVETEEPDPRHVEEEPCDIQMEYRLSP